VSMQANALVVQPVDACKTWHTQKKFEQQTHPR